MKKNNRCWSVDKLVKYAKTHNNGTLNSWRKQHKASYDAAYKRGIHRQIAGYLGLKCRGVPDRLDVLASAVRYKSITEWQKAEPGMFDVARRMMLLGELRKMLKWGKQQTQAIDIGVDTIGKVIIYPYNMESACLQTNWLSLADLSNTHSHGFIIQKWQTPGGLWQAVYVTKDLMVCGPGFEIPVYCTKRL